MIRTILLIVLLAVFTVSSAFVIHWFLDAARVRREMEDLRAMIRTDTPESTERTEAAPGSASEETEAPTLEPVPDGLFHPKV